MDLTCPEILERHRSIWRSRPLLGWTYAQWYGIIEGMLSDPGGAVVELGAGSGNYKEWRGAVLAGDIVPVSWLDFQADAHCLPFASGSLHDIVAIDLLHHLHSPVTFLREIQRVLRSKGRVHLIEPYPSVLSLPLYRRFHPEPFSFTMPDFSSRSKEKVKTPNQAMACLLFFKYRRRFENAFGDSLRIIKRQRMALLAYPASGGFEGPQLVPYWSRSLLKALECLVAPLAPLLAFRCYVVCERV
ncbi:MAG: methyltransferase domain-containing protein [Chitinispirillaceae bacterium]|nr:methyltransferase domain-containing protein [Chitinispirillaceae bacterium]